MGMGVRPLPHGRKNFQKPIDKYLKCDIIIIVKGRDNSNAKYVFDGKGLRSTQKKIFKNPLTNI